MTVPIVPGPSEPYTLADVMPEPEPRTRRPRWVVPVVVALAVLLLVGGAAAIVLGRRSAALDTTAIPAPTLRQNIPTPLRDAYIRCGAVGEISDADRTLFLDMRGEKVGSGTLSTTDVFCVLGRLEAPSFVTTKMRQTRALDGQVSGSWSTFEASWTYHPDKGLDVLIHDKSSG